MKITKISVYQIDVPIKPATISHDRVMSPKTSPNGCTAEMDGR